MRFSIYNLNDDVSEKQFPEFNKVSLPPDLNTLQKVSFLKGDLMKFLL
jgi:hypothetical protein